jgi:hypothetical protein
MANSTFITGLDTWTNTMERNRTDILDLTPLDIASFIADSVGARVPMLEKLAARSLWFRYCNRNLTYEYFNGTNTPLYDFCWLYYYTHIGMLQSQLIQGNDSNFNSAHEDNQVYRLSVNAWIPIQGIHCYSNAMFRCTDIHVDDCIYCTELKDRMYNYHSGRVDAIISQYDGSLDHVISETHINLSELPIKEAHEMTHQEYLLDVQRRKYAYADSHGYVTSHTLHEDANRTDDYHYLYERTVVGLFEDNVLDVFQDNVIPDSLRTNYIYRASVNRWILPTAITCYSSIKFRCAELHENCIYCTELIDRWYNQVNGLAESFVSQYTGELDDTILEMSIANPTYVVHRREPTYVYSTDMDDSFDQGDYDYDADEDEDDQVPDLIPLNQFVTRLQQETEVIRYDLPSSIDCVCFDDEKVDLLVRMNCGSAMHNECFSKWISEHTTCPFCRRLLDTATVESQSQVLVEYTASDDVGDLDYDDPIEFSQIVHRVGMLQCYVFTGVVAPNQRYIITGPIQQVKDLHDNKTLMYETDRFDMMSGRELQFIASGELTVIQEEISTCSFVVEQPVVHVDHEMSAVEPTTYEILMAVNGTYGDVVPFLKMRDELVTLGHKVFVIGPTGFNADLEFDISDLLQAYRASPTSIPSLGVFMSSGGVRAAYDSMHALLSRQRFDHIIASPGFPAIKHLSQISSTPITFYSSIPTGEGAYSYTPQDTSFLKSFAQWNEELTFRICDGLSCMDRLVGRSTVDPVVRSTDDVVYAIAPELYEKGDGCMTLNALTDDHYDYDIFYTLGSLAQLSVENNYIETFKRMPELKVLFQTNHHTGIDQNITFISQCNHESIMRDVPVILCHGGSGTMQTAFKYGCRVLVHPFWVDQKFWVPWARKRNFVIDFIAKTSSQVINQIRNFCHNKKHEKYRIQSRTPRHFALQMLKRIHARVPYPNGVFIYSTEVENKFFNFLGKLENTLFGDARCTHVGIAEHVDGVTTYYELTYDPYSVTTSRSVGIDPRVIRLKYLDVKIDVELFLNQIPKAYGPLNNCRTMMDSYLGECGVDYDLTRFHNENKLTNGLLYSGSHRKVLNQYVTERQISTVSSVSTKSSVQSVPSHKRIHRVPMLEYTGESSYLTYAELYTLSDELSIRIWCDNLETRIPELIGEQYDETVYCSYSKGLVRWFTYPHITQYDKKYNGADMNELVYMPNSAYAPAGYSIPNVDVSMIVRPLIEKYNLTEFTVSHGGMRSTQLMFVNHVIKITTDALCDAMESRVMPALDIFKRRVFIYAHIMHRLYDDGLPVRRSMLVYNERFPPFDVHRENVCAFGGIAMLIDQADTPYHGSIKCRMRDILGSSNIRENGGGGLCLFKSVEKLTGEKDVKVRIHPTFTQQCISFYGRELSLDNWHEDGGDLVPLVIAEYLAITLEIYDEDRKILVIVNKGHKRYPLYLSSNHFMSVHAPNGAEWGVKEELDTL